MSTEQPSRLRLLTFGILVFGMLSANASVAQTPASATSGPDAAALRPIVDRLVGSLVQEQAIPGAIVGVSWHGRRSYFGYSGTGQRPYDPRTIVEIGSITKVFTTALFAEAINEGRVDRDASLQSLMPNLPLHPCTARITAIELADFSSGMPSLPGDAPRQLARRGIDSYTSEDFKRWVSRWAPAEEEGCELPASYRYSNASIGLLGYILADRLNTPWPRLVRERITGPLGMTSTAMEVPPDQAGRVAQGFGKNGQSVMPWPVFAWYAAGALRSDASDMLSFGEAALGHSSAGGASVPPALARALRDAMRPIYQPEGQTFSQGMAWVENTGDPDAVKRPVFFKAGGTDGFNSVIVVNPGKDMAIFISASRPKSGIPQLGVELSRQLPQ